MNRNRLSNTQNQYQRFDKYKRVLCVCSAGLLRSPTIARVLQQEYGYNTRAAGINEEYALIPVDEYLVEWADEIVCADHEHTNVLKMKYPELKKVEVITLALPDMYDYMNENLVSLIKERYKETLKDE